MLKGNLGARTESQNRAANMEPTPALVHAGQEVELKPSISVPSHTDDGLSYKSNWLILCTACYLNCFSLPIVPLCLQATLQPNSSPVPPFYTISDLHLFTVCSVLNRGIAAAFPASVLCTYFTKKKGKKQSYSRWT